MADTLRHNTIEQIIEENPVGAHHMAAQMSSAINEGLSGIAPTEGTPTEGTQGNETWPDSI
jgi:hypothetical protein